jgi:2-polyprenyl-3-methyl-5-hydroxy-6-metoxy-1,4-benzoquinol methylase
LSVRAVDRLLQEWRIAVAIPYVQAGDRLLDIGCFDGALIDRVLPRIASAVGIDPLATPRQNGKVTIIRGTVPGDVPLPAQSFDCITMLATLEHVEDPATLGRACRDLLKPGGRLIVTVPHPLVDYIVQALVWIGASDPADLEGHHGFDVNLTEQVFTEVGFRTMAQRRFELGFNRLYVFEKRIGA